MPYIYSLPYVYSVEKSNQVGIIFFTYMDQIVKRLINIQKVFNSTPSHFRILYSL